MKSLNDKLLLELATYEDGMVSTEDYITQTIAVCNNYGWIAIEDSRPPIAGRWYDTYTYCREGDRTVRELYYAGLDEVEWLSGSGADWNYGVTHFRERPAGPEV